MAKCHQLFLSSLPTEIDQILYNSNTTPVGDVLHPNCQIAQLINWAIELPSLSNGQVIAQFIKWAITDNLECPVDQLGNSVYEILNLMHK